MCVCVCVYVSLCTMHWGIFYRSCVLRGTQYIVQYCILRWHPGTHFWFFCDDHLGQHQDTHSPDMTVTGNDDLPDSPGISPLVFQKDAGRTKKKFKHPQPSLALPRPFVEPQLLDTYPRRIKRAIQHDDRSFGS